jgi:hypothetical protein
MLIAILAVPWASARMLAHIINQMQWYTTDEARLIGRARARLAMGAPPLAGSALDGKTDDG